MRLFLLFIMKSLFISSAYLVYMICPGDMYWYDICTDRLQLVGIWLSMSWFKDFLGTSHGCSNFSLGLMLELSTGVRSLWQELPKYDCYSRVIGYEAERVALCLPCVYKLWDNPCSLFIHSIRCQILSTPPSLHCCGFYAFLTVTRSNTEMLGPHGRIWHIIT